MSRQSFLSGALPQFQDNYIQAYYKDYQGNSGTLTVKGVFKIVSYFSSNYLLPSSFINKHCQFLSEEEYSWFEQSTTDYTEPSDAKYNYLITLTDNSQEQISNALFSSLGYVKYAVSNSVYTQLSFMIETVNELKTIFLVMGVVFGIFSGLMLFNFISASITAKPFFERRGYKAVKEQQVERKGVLLTNYVMIKEAVEKRNESNGFSR